MIKKIPVFPPRYHNDKFPTDFKQKADLFDSFPAQKYSELPTKLITQAN